jgi:hypothetical protein
MSAYGKNAPVDQVLDTIPKAAERLSKALGQSIGKYKVRAMIAERQIDAVMLGREQMVSIISIERWVDAVRYGKPKTEQPAAAAAE